MSSKHRSTSPKETPLYRAAKTKVPSRSLQAWREWNAAFLRAASAELESAKLRGPPVDSVAGRQLMRDAMRRAGEEYRASKERAPKGSAPRPQAAAVKRAVAELAASLLH